MFSDSKAGAFFRPYADEVISAITAWTGDVEEQKELAQEIGEFMTWAIETMAEDN